MVGSSSFTMRREYEEDKEVRKEEKVADVKGCKCDEENTGSEVGQ